MNTLERSPQEKRKGGGNKVRLDMILKVKRRRLPTRWSLQKERISEILSNKTYMQPEEKRRLQLIRNRREGKEETAGGGGDKQSQENLPFNNINLKYEYEAIFNAMRNSINAMRNSINADDSSSARTELIQIYLQKLKILYRDNFKNAYSFNPNNVKSFLSWINFLSQ
jgi:hypothetical protein